MSSRQSVESNPEDTGANPEDADSIIWDLLCELPPDVRASISLPKPACSEEFALPAPKRAKFQASSSRGTSEDARRQYRKINDHVYEVCSPPSGKRPSVELIFFHGLQLKGAPEAHLTTWHSADESELWPTWILPDIPDARILIISYDASPERTSKKGHMDMYATTENLLHDLMDDVRVGQDGCPVVLIGHCIGGLVMKQLCVYAARELGLSSNKPNDYRQTFLNNVKGLFFYASPHHGTRLADVTKGKGDLFEDFTTLNTKASRQNGHFCKLRQEKGWRTFGIGETQEVTLGSFKGLVVREASARSDMDRFYTSPADHFNVCRPESKNSSAFRCLLKFIDEIVKENPRRQARKIALEEAVGLEQHVKKVVRILEREKRVAIVGMGGMGKTTLAKSVYDTAAQNFEYTCFLENVKFLVNRERVSNREVLQRYIIENLDREGSRVNAKRFHWSDLKEKKVLFVLDDVEDEFQGMVMTEEDSFSDHSRVIVTSRHEGQFRMHVYPLQPLDGDNSKVLFCFHAFGKMNPPTGYKDRVTEFTRKCGGLPLALKVAGRYLRPRNGVDDPNTWKDALSRLEKAQPLDGSKVDELRLILETSFESLGNEEKEMFKDIGICFHGERLDEVKEIWRMRRWAAHNGWKNLLDRGLVTEVYGNRGRSHFIGMHEILRDYSRSIACPQLENISSHNRLCYNGHWSFRNEENCQVEVLKITTSPGGCIMEISEFRKLVKLRVLWLKLSLDHMSGYLNLAILSGECYLFPKALVHLRIEGLDLWMVGSQTVKRENRTLLSLKLEGGELVRLPTSLGQLHALEDLRIANCRRLETFPHSLGQLHALKDLRIENCYRLKTFPDSLGQLRALEYLEISECRNLSLPDNLGQLIKLKHLAIREYHSLGNLGDCLGQMQALEHLEIRETRFWPDEYEDEPEVEKAHPTTLGQLHALKHLQLETRYFEKGFHENLMQLQRLEYLEIQDRKGELKFRGPPWLQGLPNNLGDLKALETLRMRGCDRVRSLPSTVGKLHALKKLQLEDMHLPVFSDGLCELQGLEYLEFSGEISALPEALGQLRGLKHLMLCDCKFTAIPDSVGEFQALEFLYLCKCSNLESPSRYYWETSSPEAVERVLLSFETCSGYYWGSEGFGETGLSTGGLRSSAGFYRTASRFTTLGNRALQETTSSSRFSWAA